MITDTSTVELTSRHMVRSAVLGLVATSSIVLGALLGGSPFETHLPGAWFFGMPGGLFGSMASSNHPGPPIYAFIGVYGGLILLTRVWIGLLRQLTTHRNVPLKRVVFVVAIWAVPLLVTPPLFSRDVYSYAGQGEMVSHHIDPYVYGTGVLGSTPFSTMPDSVWTNTPSPYGPTFLSLDGVLDKASGHKILPDIMLLRLLEVAGLALMVAATPSLARRLKRDPAQAVLLGAGSPLVLITLVAGAHNDALMLGLLMAGLAVAQRWGTVPGVVLCAAAAGVKSPAALGIVFLGWVWAGPGASVRRRVAYTFGAGLIGLCTLGAISAVSKTGWGWLHASTAADQSFTGVTPVDAVSKLASGLGSVVHVHFSELGARTVFSVIGLLCAAAIGMFLLLRSPRENVLRNLGLTLLVVALLGPILWAWYATWGVIVLAPAVSGKLRQAIIALSTFEVFVGVMSVKNVITTLFHSGLFPDLILVAAIFAIVIIPLGQFGRIRASKNAHRSPAEPQMIGAQA